MTTIRTLVTLPAAAALLVLPVLSAGAAHADAPANFGQHVSVCAQTMGFDAEMNPSMHHGPSGSDGMTCALP